MRRVPERHDRVALPCRSGARRRRLRHPRRELLQRRVGEQRERGVPQARVRRRHPDRGVHVAEALPEASVFKLGCTWPLPAEALRAFAASVESLYVVEEASEYLSESVRALGVEVSTLPHPLPRDGELAGLVRAAFGIEEPACLPMPDDVPDAPRPCAQDPPASVFKELSRMKAVVTGDRLLLARRAAAAFGHGRVRGHGRLSVHVARLRAGLGRHRAPSRRGRHRRFDVRPFGVSALISTVYNKGGGTVCVLDNRTTAMTGRQGNPLDGETLQKRPFARARPRGRRPRRGRRGRAHGRSP